MGAENSRSADEGCATVVASRALLPYAVPPATTRGRMHHEPEATERTPHQRDRDRILHSGAFRRLMNKTQVFVYHEGDFYRTRLTHSLEVSQIARSVGRSLGLNEDLAEALALAHDLGHTCFGHAGEDALDACMKQWGGFDHNDQTLRVLVKLEKVYADFDGLNLTWEVLEGVVKHNGPLVIDGDRSRVPETIAEIDAVVDFELDRYASAEAQVAAIADDIAYNAHDIDDGLRAGLFSVDDLGAVPMLSPIIEEVRESYGALSESRMIQEMVRRLIGAMVQDLLAETRSRLAALGPGSADDIRRHDRAVVAFSATMERHNAALKSFLFTRMYRHYKVNRMASKAKRIVRDLFEVFMSEPNTLPPPWQAVGAETGSGRRVLSAQEMDEKDRARLVADYIAGMTDRYAMLEHQRLFDVMSRT